MPHAEAKMRRCLLGLVLACLLAGCGSGPSFVARGYDNLTAYYNTFYNAEKAFDQAQRAIEENEQAIDQSAYLSIFPSPERAQQRQDLDKAIEKSADVLRKHPNSRWVDDALMLIGKARYYLRNYAAANQKFQEVVSLDSPREDEARFWLARALMANVAYEEGIQQLQESLGREDTAPEWASKMQLVLGELYVKQGSWEQAITALEKGLGDIGRRDLAARAYFLLGQVYETAGQYDQAIAAYRQAQQRRPRYELAYAAAVSAVRVEGLHGDAQKALDALAKMQRDDKHYENRAELAFLRGHIYQAQGRTEEAVSAYRTLLYDSEKGLAADVQPRVHNALGELYRDQYGDYVTAAAHFDTAATALGGSGTSSAADEVAQPPSAITGAQGRADVFGTFAEARSKVSRLDSLLHLGSLDDEAYRQAILRIRKQRAREMLEEREAQNRREQERAFDQGRRNDRTSRQQSTASASAQGGEAGFLFHKNPVRVQEGQLGFVEQWGDRPLVENWRRRAAISSIADEEAAVAGSVTRKNMETGDQILPEVDVSAVPRDSISRMQMLEERASARYGLGNVLFLLMNQPDSAAAWYRKVITEDDGQPVANRAYYALAEVQRSVGDTAAARQLYQQVIRRQPAPDLARRVRQRLGQAPDQTTDADSLALAEEAYAHARVTWEQQQYETAFTNMLETAGRYPKTSIAPKALLAAGSIYLEWAQRDSLDLSSGIPLMLPDSLLAKNRLEVTAPAADSPSSDTTATRPTADSLAARTPATDSLAMDSPAADSLAAAPARADSLAGRDSLSADEHRATLDSLARDRRQMGSPSASDSVAAETGPNEKRLHLATLLTTITKRYPEAPQAERASRLLEALQEHRSPDSPTKADTTGSASSSPDPVSTLKNQDAAPKSVRDDTAAESSRPNARRSRDARPAQMDTTRSVPIK